MNRNFKGVWIPKQIWLSKKLSLQEKVFLIEIDSLDNEQGCYAGNSYFADFFNLSKSRVSQIIQQLEKRGLIVINYEYKQGTKEISRRLIKINKTAYIDLISDDVSEDPGIQDSKDGCLEKATDNNQISNNTKSIKSKDLIEAPPPLISLKSKQMKKRNDLATMDSMIYAFTEHDGIKAKLKDYYQIRVKKGLTPIQWQIILEDLRKFAGDDAKLAIEKINNAIAGGYMQIIASWEKDKKSTASKPKFDNTAGRKTKAVATMTEQERIDFDNDLARDNSGNLIKF
jgi:hypothetical protein